MLGMWRGFRSSEEFNNFLANKPSLEEVLGHESITDEIYCGNQQLQDYMDSEKLSELIDLITVEPSPDAPHNRCYKFPYVASELISPDYGKMLDIFFENEDELLKKLFGFLDSEDINLLLSGYFVKALDSLLQRNPSKLLDFIFTEKYHKKLTKHLYSQSIADFLSKCLLSMPSEAHLSSRLDVLVELVTKINCTFNPAVSYNSQEVLCKVISDTNESGTHRALVEYLKTKDVMEVFFEHINESYPTYPWVARSVAKVLKALLSQEENTCNPNLEKISELLETFKSNVKVLVKSLKVPPSPDMTNRNKEVKPIFGEERVILSEITGLLCRSNYEDLLKQIADFKVVPHLTEEFFSHEWNTMLHNSYYTLAENILHNKNHDLKRSLLEEASLPSKLVHYGTNPCSDEEKPKRLGFMGHVHKLANLILKLEKNQPYIKEVLQKTQGWKEFTQNELKAVNEAENRHLGGKATLELMRGSSEEEGPTITLDYDRLLGKNKEPEEEEEDNDDFPDVGPELTAKDLEDLPNMFDSEQIQRDIYSATQCLNNANKDEFESMHFLENHYWKLPSKLEDLEELD